MKGSMKGSTPRYGLVLVAALVVALSACRDVFLTEPAPAGSGILDLAPLLLAGPSAAPANEVLQSATDIGVRVTTPDGDLVLLDRIVPLEVSGGQLAARVEIPLERESVDVVGEFVIRHEGDALFQATETFTLRQGEETELSPELDPEVAGVEITAIPPITTLGTEVLIEARAHFATGETIEGATLSYSSSDASVLEHQGGNAFEVVGEGTATVTVTATAGSSEINTSDNAAEVGVSVAAEVDGIVASPTSLDLDVGDSETLHVTARDAGGNALSRTVQFTSNNVGVATVVSSGGGTAEVTGISQGTAIITAAVGDHSVDVPVTVTQPLGTGDVQVTLTWDNTADLDLHVIDPFQERIYFGNPTSTSGGILDVDDQDGFGPENIFWPTGAAPDGTYIVEVNHFAGPAPANWEVTVLTPDGTETYQGSVTSEATVHVVTFSIGAPQTTCPSEGALTPGDQISGSLSAGDCTHPLLPSGEVARAWTFTPGQEAVRMEISGGTGDVSLWRGDAGEGGRVGLVRFSWGPTILHLDPAGTYTLTAEGEPGEHFVLSTDGATVDETEVGPDLIQWSEPVPGRSMAVTGADPINTYQEHEDFHVIWPKPGEQWTVTAMADVTLRSRMPGAQTDQINEVVQIQVDGNVSSNGGHVFYVAPYGNEPIPTNYTFSISAAPSGALYMAPSFHDLVMRRRIPARPETKLRK